MDQKQSSKDNNLKDVTVNYEYVVVKNQKLSVALYLVTNSLSDQEPLKWKLREKAIELSGELSQSRVGSVFYKMSLLDKVRRLFEEMTTLLDISRALGGVSEMNLNILKEEYQQLKGQIEEVAGVNQFKSSLEVPALVAPRAEPQSKVEAARSFERQPVAVASIHERELDTLKAHKSITRPTTNPSKNVRKEAIIAYLAGKDWTSIKDISEAVPDYSQKTVQRELSDLVEQGVLKKRGDRRWSRYLLVK